MSELQKPERNEKNQDYGRASEVAKDGPSPRVAEWEPIHEAIRQIESTLTEVDHIENECGGGLTGLRNAHVVQQAALNDLRDKLIAAIVAATREEAKSEANHDAGENESSTDKPKFPNQNLAQPETTQEDLGEPEKCEDTESVCSDCGEHPKKWRGWGETCENIECSGTYGKANPSPPRRVDTSQVNAVIRSAQGHGPATSKQGAADLKNLAESVARAAQPVPIQGEGPYRVEMRDGHGGPICVLVGPAYEHGVELDDQPLNAFAVVANAAHQAGASSKDQVVEAAAAVVFASKHRAHDPIALHRLIQEDLATALNPNSETEK